MVIDFKAYVEAKLAREQAAEAARLAEIARRDHLAQFLSDMLEELEAA